MNHQQRRVSQQKHLQIFAAILRNDSSAEMQPVLLVSNQSERCNNLQTINKSEKMALSMTLFISAPFGLPPIQLTNG